MEILVKSSVSYGGDRVVSPVFSTASRLWVPRSIQ